MEYQQISDYARALRGDLPSGTFDPAPGRLAWLALHLLVVAGSIFLIARGFGGLPAAAGLALVIGHSFACMGFVAHETLHGAVVRGSLARRLIGGIAFAPFLVSPRFWTIWHNRVHHGHTMDPTVDPDSYPSLAEYHSSRALRVVDKLALGRGHAAGFVSLLVGFTGQSLFALWRVGGDRRFMTRREQVRAFAETAAIAAAWIGLGVVIGLLPLVFAFVLPLVIANVILMSYILTNHSLSPYTSENDPLLNSLTVTTPRVFEVLHLGFGYHVEHHLFPSMSPRRAGLVRRLLQERWPARYQSMSLWQALVCLVRTPRIHLTATTLVDPRTGTLAPTILPRTAEAAPVAAVAAGEEAEPWAAPDGCAAF